MDCFASLAMTEDSFRDAAKHQTLNLKIPRSRPARPRDDFMSALAQT